MSNKYTYTQIASDFQLWSEYMDPNAEMSAQEFDALSTAEKIAMQTEAFGAE